MSQIKGKHKAKFGLKNLVLSAIFLALAMLLPFLTGQIPEIGNMLLPMHLPVLLCGFACGGGFGFVLGFTAPLFRSLLFGMPKMFPMAVGMAIEMAVYGLFAGIFYRLLPKKPIFIYVSLVFSMLLGRLAWGLASFLLYGILGTPFSVQMFLAGAFFKAVPGILLQLLLVPPIVLAINRKKYSKQA